MASVRKARESDLNSIEYVCKATAKGLDINNEAMGNAVAKTYSSYYVHRCLNTCFVLADDTDKAVGYIVCEPDFKRFRHVFRKTEVPVVWKIKKSMGMLAWFLPFPYTLFGKKYPAHLHIDILDAYQNKGYGTLLMNALLTELKREKTKGVMLITNSDNYGAIRFYKKFGFHTVISVKKAATIMAKNLSK